MLLVSTVDHSEAAVLYRYPLFLDFFAIQVTTEHWA